MCLSIRNFGSHTVSSEVNIFYCCLIEDEPDTGQEILVKRDLIFSMLATYVLDLYIDRQSIIDCMEICKGK